MGKMPRPPIRRTRMRIDVRQIEDDQRIEARKRREFAEMRANPERKAITPKCPTCGKFRIPVKVRTTNGDHQRCDECFSKHGDLIEIIRWGR